MLTTDIAYFEALYDGISAVFSGIWSVITTIATNLVNDWNMAMNAMGNTSMTTTAQTGGFFQILFNVCKTVMDGIVLAINVATWAFSNMGLLISQVLTRSAANVITDLNVIAYAFTGVLGPTLLWMAQNWQELFIDMMNIQKTVLSNLLVNAANFGAAIWKAVKGEGFTFDWTPLTEGFHTALTSLPNIADRQIGPLEASLKKQSDTLGDAIGVGLSDYLAQQKQKAKDGAKAVEGGFKGALDWVKDKFTHPVVPTIKPPAIKTPQIDVDTDKAEGKIKKLKAHADDWKTVLAGSAEAMQAAAEARVNAALGLSDNGGSGKAVEAQQAIAENIASGKASSIAGSIVGPLQAQPSATATASPAPLPDRATEPAREAAGDNWQKLMDQLAIVVARLTTTDKNVATIATTPASTGTFSL